MNEMGWQETRIFELAALPMEGDEKLREALRLLEEARAAYRVHDFKAVVIRMP